MVYGWHVVGNMVGSMWSACGLYSMWSVNRSVCDRHVVGYVISGMWLVTWLVVCGRYVVNTFTCIELLHCWLHANHLCLYICRVILVTTHIFSHEVSSDCRWSLVLEKVLT